MSLNLTRARLVFILSIYEWVSSESTNASHNSMADCTQLPLDCTLIHHGLEWKTLKLY
jgi:hypothetical protein